MNLREQLDAIEPRIPELDCFVVPSSFDPDDADLRAFPISNEWKWTSCEVILKHFKAHAVMMRLPLFWQLEPALHAACRTAGAPIFINDPENMPVGMAAIRSAGIDTVVTSASDAATFAEYLKSKQVPVPRNWLMVQTTGDWNIPETLREDGIHVAQEVHIFPGLVVLYQCETLADTKEARFHLADGFSLASDATRSYVSNTDLLVPIERLEIPTVVENGTCASGKPVYARTN